jgi:hypothetical protein
MYNSGIAVQFIIGSRSFFYAFFPVLASYDVRGDIDRDPVRLDQYFPWFSSVSTEGCYDQDLEVSEVQTKSSC